MINTLLLVFYLHFFLVFQGKFLYIFILHNKTNQKGDFTIGKFL